MWFARLGGTASLVEAPHYDLVERRQRARVVLDACQDNIHDSAWLEFWEGARLAVSDHSRIEQPDSPARYTLYARPSGPPPPSAKMLTKRATSVNSILTASA